MPRLQPVKISINLLMGWMLFIPALASAEPGGNPKERFNERWVYASHNLLEDKNADEVVKLIDRASKSGYTGMVFNDYKLAILDRMPARYFKNVQRMRDAARAANLEIIPSVFPIGYSSGLLAHDPNLAEGLPVVDAPFVVKGREVVPIPDQQAKMLNGDLEEAKDNRFASFFLQDDPGKTTFVDREVVHHGNSSVRIQDSAEGQSRNYRLAQRMKVRPHSCYRFSAWVKTRDLKPTSGFQLLARGAGWRHPPLTFYEGHLQPTQEWTRVEVVFNSLGEDEIELYAGHWGGQSGTLWMDELALEELSLVNVLRREGAPLKITSEDGKTAFEEGKDFLPVRDTQLGQEPFAGEYEFRHAGAKLQLTDKSRIKNGDRLRVSWYHPVIMVGFQVVCCLTEHKIYALLRDQARRVNDLFKPRTFFMSHDEIRVANWCQSCQSRKETPGQLLANNVSESVRILREVNPGARIVVWSDMFDPNHNAVSDFYLVHGTMEGSWKGLPSDVIIANWNLDKGAKSLKWFSDRGHSQILAGYYDSDIGNFKKWNEASRGIPKVIGFMYTTWDNNYADLERYGRALLGRE